MRSVLVSAELDTDTCDLTPDTPDPTAPLLDLQAAIDVPEHEAAAQPALPAAAPSPAYDDTNFKDENNADDTTQPVAQTIVQDFECDPTVVTPADRTAATSSVDDKIVKLSYYVRVSVAERSYRHRLTQLLNTVIPHS